MPGPHQVAEELGLALVGDDRAARPARSWSGCPSRSQGPGPGRRGGEVGASWAAVWLGDAAVGVTQADGLPRRYAQAGGGRGAFDGPALA